MLTYQDFLQAENRNNFIQDAINQYKSSDIYRHYRVAKTYFEGENDAINNRTSWAEKRKIPDVIFHRIGNGIYPEAIKHWVYYTLGNGLDIDEDKKKSLGSDFNIRFIAEGVIPAVHAGICYAFWEGRKKGEEIKYFDASQAFALLDEYSGEIMVLIRFWQLDTDKPLNIELFEQDGITVYVQESESSEIKEVRAKKAYKVKVRQYQEGSPLPEEFLTEENYSTLPIFPIYVNLTKRSELTKNLKSCLDAYDFIASDGIDDVLRNEGIYNYLKNYGGSSFTEFLDYLETKVFPQKGGVGDTVTAGHSTDSVQAPFEGKKMWLDWLEQRANKMLSMPDTVSTRGVTATEIKDMNKYLDTKADVLEWRACTFVGQIFDLLGVAYDEGELSFKRRSITNDTENINNISTVISDGYIDTMTAIEKCPIIEVEEQEDVYNRVMLEQQNRAFTEFPIEPQPGAEPPTEPPQGAEPS